MAALPDPQWGASVLFQVPLLVADKATHISQVAHGPQPLIGIDPSDSHSLNKYLFLASFPFSFFFPRWLALSHHHQEADLFLNV